MNETRPALRLLDDQLRFLLSWVGNPMKMGAVVPSGKALAYAMAAQVDPLSSGLIIELGPGTGPVTEALIEGGIAQERIVALEYNAEFASRLQKRYPRITVVHGDAYDLPARLHKITADKASAVLSSLPLFNDPPAKRIELLRAAFDLLEENAPFVQFTYSFSSPIPRDLLPVQASVSDWVLKNVPPARVWTYRRQNTAAGNA